jgi:hypothetical protein
MFVVCPDNLGGRGWRRCRFFCDGDEINITFGGAGDLEFLSCLCADTSKVVTHRSDARLEGII